jgi:hypothetical protein
MPSGYLASADVQAGINTLIYQAPGGRAFNVTVRICNRNATNVAVRLALTSGGLDTLSDSNWLEYDVIIRANGSIERFNISMAGYQSIIGYSDTSNVSFQVGGSN